MPMVDREGIFKATPLDWGLEKSDGGAWGVTIKWQLDEMLQGSDWAGWSQYGQHAYSRTWFIKKDGTANDSGVETLRDVLGWDGDPDSIKSKAWTPPRAQINVKKDEYNGKASYKAEWINPLDYTGKAVRSATDDELSSLKSMFGSQLRALFGGKTTPPAGKPATQPKAKKSPPPPKTQPPPVSDKDSAWARFCEVNDGLVKPLPETEVATRWARALTKLFGTKAETELTPEDWGRLFAYADEAVCPF